MGGTRLSLGGSTANSVTIQNSLATSRVTVAATSTGMSGELLLVSSDTTLNLGGAGGASPLTFKANVSGNGPYYLVTSNSALNIGSIGSGVTLKLDLNNGLGLSKAVGLSASSDALNIDGGLSGTINATMSASYAMDANNAYGMYTSDALSLTGGLSGHAAPKNEIPSGRI